MMSVMKIVNKSGIKKKLVPFGACFQGGIQINSRMRDMKLQNKINRAWIRVELINKVMKWMKSSKNMTLKPETLVK